MASPCRISVRLVTMGNFVVIGTKVAAANILPNKIYGVMTCTKLVVVEMVTLGFFNSFIIS